MRIRSKASAPSRLNTRHGLSRHPSSQTPRMVLPSTEATVNPAPRNSGSAPFGILRSEAEHGPAEAGVRETMPPGHLYRPP